MGALLSCAAEGVLHWNNVYPCIVSILSSKTLFKQPVTSSFGVTRFSVRCSVIWVKFTILGHHMAISVWIWLHSQVTILKYDPMGFPPGIRSSPIQSSHNLFITGMSKNFNIISETSGKCSFSILGFGNPKKTKKNPKKVKNIKTSRPVSFLPET